MPEPAELTTLPRGPGAPAHRDPSDAVLEVRDLHVRYGVGVGALRGANLRLGRGEIVALLGPNGAGKTTMARSITGLLGFHGGSIVSGDILLNGEKVRDHSASRLVRAGVSQVLEGRQTVAELTVEENLRIGGYSAGDRRKELAAVLDHVLDLFPVLRKRYRDQAGYLSGGEQQMLVIGRALMQQPKVLLLDEPSLGLSPKMAGEINSLIRRINADGTSILLIEQNASAALELSSYAYLLESGETALEGRSAELLSNDHVQGAYLGGGESGRSYRASARVHEHPPIRSEEDGEPHLAVDGLTLRIGGVTALDDVSFTVRKGELFAVIGPNGAGKTSLLNSLSGFYRPQEGAVRFGGTSLTGRSPADIARLGCARTFQNLALFDHLPVIDNVMVGRERFRRSGALASALWRGRARGEEKKAREFCSELIDMVGLSKWRDRQAGVLPYGLRKRVELARALALEPELLLLDEPVAGMNFDETAELMSHVVRARSEFGLTVLLVEHDLHLVMDLADRVLALDFGHPLVVDVPDVVRADPAVITAYLGTAGTEAGPEAGVTAPDSEITRRAERTNFTPEARP
ncbi:ATP-binding cassette domain-containing protein [Streptomyces sp. NPDC088747]|uniref:ATP-binding cassette domain-containing protein n=1 Tax=Streptomyces sp. NPDC088747 TaxID=3365886 RepID=UPI00380B0A43